MVRLCNLQMCVKCSPLVGAGPLPKMQAWEEPHLAKAMHSHTTCTRLEGHSANPGGVSSCCDDLREVA